METGDTPPQAVPLPGEAVPKEYPLEFTATAGEYFRIWIVNLALSVATLGIYSAWAKVRRKRYFHGCTHIDGDSFEYRGRPIPILKGRILAVAVAGTVYAVLHFTPLWFPAVLLAAVFVVPLLLVRSFAFNAHNTVFRGVRMRFHGGYWRCLRLLLTYGLFTAFTLGLGYFHLKTRLTEFIIRNHAYGTTRFTVPDLKKPFFSVYARMIGLGIVVVVLVGALTYEAATLTHQMRRNSPLALALNALTYVMYLGIFAYVRARITNAMWDRASLGTLRFRCTLGALRLYAIYLGNVAAILCSAGLATPWAVVRTLRYRAQCFTLIAPDGLAQFAADSAIHVGAAGEEVGAMLDIDFSL